MSQGGSSRAAPTGKASGMPAMQQVLKQNFLYLGCRQAVRRRNYGDYGIRAYGMPAAPQVLSQIV
jgi:hypothetical protein